MVVSSIQTDIRQLWHFNLAFFIPPGHNWQFLSSSISLAKQRNRMQKFLDIISEYEETKFH